MEASWRSPRPRCMVSRSLALARAMTGRRPCRESYAGGGGTVVSPVIARPRSGRSNPGGPALESWAGGVPCGPARFWIASPALAHGLAMTVNRFPRHCEAAQRPKQSRRASPRVMGGRRAVRPGLILDCFARACARARNDGEGALASHALAMAGNASARGPAARLVRESLCADSLVFDRLRSPQGRFDTGLCKKFAPGAGSPCGRCNARLALRGLPVCTPARGSSLCGLARRKYLFYRDFRDRTPIAPR